jgi:hypothetical protein
MEKIIEGKLIRSNSAAAASTDVDEQLRQSAIRLAQQKSLAEKDIDLVQSSLSATMRTSREASQTASSQQSLNETLDSSSQSNSSLSKSTEKSISLRARKQVVQSAAPSTSSKPSSTLLSRNRMPPPIAHSTPARTSSVKSNNHTAVRVSPRKSPTKTRVTSATTTTTTKQHQKVPDVRAKTKVQIYSFKCDTILSYVDILQADLRRKAEIAQINKSKQSVTVASRPTAVVTTVGNGTETARASKRRPSERTGNFTLNTHVPIMIDLFIFR